MDYHRARCHLGRWENFFLIPTNGIQGPRSTLNNLFCIVNQIKLKPSIIFIIFFGVTTLKHSYSHSSVVHISGKTAVTLTKPEDKHLYSKDIMVTESLNSMRGKIHILVEVMIGTT
jgi:hypothetical protein